MQQCDLKNQVKKGDFNYFCEFWGFHSYEIADSVS
jgi:hypothetical protein